MPPLVSEHTRRSQFGSTEEVSPKAPKSHRTMSLAGGMLRVPVHLLFSIHAQRCAAFRAHCLAASNDLCNGANGSSRVGYVPLYLARWEAPGGDTPFLQHHCFKERSLCKCFQVCFLL